MEHTEYVIPALIYEMFLETRNMITESDEKRKPHRKSKPSVLQRINYLTNILQNKTNIFEFPFFLNEFEIQIGKEVSRPKRLQKN